MTLHSIELKFHFDESITDDEYRDERIEAVIKADGWRQWGQPKEILADNVALMEAINDAVHDTIGEVMGIEN